MPLSQSYESSFSGFQFSGQVMPNVLPTALAQVARGGLDIRGLAENAPSLRGEGLVLTTENAVDLAVLQPQGELPSFAFREETAWREGREASAHDVRFGYMTFEGLRGAITRPVAVKIFEGNLDAALHEYAATRLVRQTDLIRTYHPLGLATVHNNPAIITDFELGVTSFDNFPWESLESPDNDPNMLTPMIEKCALTLGLVHATPMDAVEGRDTFVVPTHGDARIRNMAWDQSGIRLIDLETFTANTFTLQPDGSLSGEDSSRLHTAILSDILLLLGSLCERQVLSDSTLAETKAFYEEHLLSYYRMVIRHPAAAVEWKDFIDFDYIKNAVDFDLENFGKA